MLQVLTVHLVVTLALAGLVTSVIAVQALHRVLRGDPEAPPRPSAPVAAQTAAPERVGAAA